MVPPRSIFLALGFLVCSRLVPGQTVINSTFVDRYPETGYNQYSDPNNWTPAEVPNNTPQKKFNVTIGVSFSLGVTFDVDAAVSNLTLSSPNGEYFDIRGKTFAVAGTTSIASPQTHILVSNSDAPGAKFDAGTLSTFSDHTLTGSYQIGSIYSTAPATLQFAGADIWTLRGSLWLEGPLARVVDQLGNDALRNLKRVEKDSILSFDDHEGGTNAPLLIDGSLGLSEFNGPATFTAAAGLTNLDSATRTLTGGFFDLYAGSKPVELRFSGADIVNLDSTVNLNGPTARITDLAGNDALRNLARILPAGFLGLVSHDLTNSQQFQNDGSLTLQTSTLTLLGALKNFDATTRTLTGGTFVLNSEGHLKFAGADIVHNAASISLVYTSTITDLAGANALRNFNDNLSAGNVVLGFRTVFTAPGDFTNAGRIETIPPFRSRFPGPSPTPSPAGRFIVPPGSRYVQTAGLTLNNGELTAEHVDILGGTLSGSGIVKGNVFVDKGAIGSGFLRIDGNLILSAGSHFQGGDFSGTKVINGEATLAGTLEVDIPNEDFVSSDQVFTVLTAALPLKGTFANAPNGARIPTIDGRGTVVVTYDASSVKAGQYQADPPPAQLVNISSRAFVWAAKDDPSGIQSVIIGGFIISGNAGKEIVVRGLGPSLAKAGLNPVLLDPILELHAADGSLVGKNDDWVENQAAIMATGLAPTDSHEAALRATVLPGTYTVVVKEKNGTAGHGLVEVYDLSQNTTSKLANISTRGYADGTNVLIGGIVAGGPGSGPADLVVRALGPELKNYGVSNALDDPTIEVRDHNGAIVAFNDDWDQDDQRLYRLGLTPLDTAEPALLLSLPRADYTAIVRAKGNSAGVATVEFYDLRH
ncbi:MAG TPA: hypothetical protein VGW57_10160 [Chthoniobacterales bacterium]|nr:hypothetical protein [Chthoniobacterales bacterium]